MDTNKYKSRSIHVDHINKATQLGMTLNEYITHLANLAAKEKTAEQANQDERLKSVEGIVASVVEALKLEKYKTDNQSRKIDQLIEIVEKQTNAFGANNDFIEALKQEITQ